MRTLHVVSFGLGPIGSEIARVAAARPNTKIVGAVDHSPEKVGRTLREVAGVDSDVRVVDSLEAAIRGHQPEVMLHSTSSSLEQVEPQLLAAVNQGIRVISTCEELSYPWRTQPGRARRIDDAARAADAAVLGTGINPGFMMDILPLFATTVCQRVDRLEVERVVDAGQRRIPLQRKVGAGLTVEAFDELVASGKVRHVGLTESTWMILDGLGWHLDAFEESIQPIIAERELDTGVGRVMPGQVAGVRQMAAATCNGEEKLRMELSMFVGAPNPQDRVRITGIPSVEFVVPGGVHGDRATAAVVVNSIPAVLGSEAGLLTMLDLVQTRVW